MQTIKKKIPMHLPVMENEVINHLKPKKNETYLDATFGAGGHTKKILEHAQCNVIALDADPETKKNAQKLNRIFKHRLTYFNQNFANMQNVLNQCGTPKVNGILLDLGLSSMQIDQPQRGFSFQKNGPLNMRLNQNNKKQKNAADIVNHYQQSELAHIFRTFGEEKKAKIIAKSIVNERKKNPITTTTQLSQIIQKHANQKTKIHPATQCFQALRIYVNHELQNLQSALEQSEQCLQQNGRLIIIAFHSLEDRIIKRFLIQKTQTQNTQSRYLPSQDEAKTKNTTPKPTFKRMFKKPITPSKDEIKKNPRARSAKLRAAIRTEHEIQKQ